MLDASYTLCCAGRSWVPTKSRELVKKKALEGAGRGAQGGGERGARITAPQGGAGRGTQGAAQGVSQVEPFSRGHWSSCMRFALRATNLASCR
jgi:hypothetical protein